MLPYIPKNAWLTLQVLRFGLFRGSNEYPTTTKRFRHVSLGTGMPNPASTQLQFDLQNMIPTEL